MNNLDRVATRDSRHASVKDPQRRTPSRWLWIGAIAVLALILVFWLGALPNVSERTDVAPTTDVPAEQVIADPNPDNPALAGNDVDAITDEVTPMPMEDADPNAVVPQDALIPPAPIRDEPAQ